MTTANITSFETMNSSKTSQNGRYTFGATLAGAVLGTAFDILAGTPMLCLCLGLCMGFWVGAAFDGIASK